jgi:hypothetical protein
MPQAADILSDPEINQAYEDVRSDKSETTWLVLKVRSETHPHLRSRVLHGGTRKSQSIDFVINSMRPPRPTT